MRALYWRIYLTLVGVLLAFALGAGWLAQRQLREERANADAAADERLLAMGELMAGSLPPPQAAEDLQVETVARWGQQLRLPVALEAADGRRLYMHPRYERREALGHEPVVIRLDDGRRLLLMRPLARTPRANLAAAELGLPPPTPARIPALLGLFVALFIGVALGAWPVVRRLTKRLEQLKQGVERFGAGELAHRVSLDGRDEVAELARSFNATADRIEALLRSHQSLLANASHELRSPLARLKMALALRDEGRPAERSERLDAEIARNLQELDALVDEVLLASRLEAGAQPLAPSSVDLLALAAELAAQHEVELGDTPEQAQLQADERLLRRALRNLLENARRYAGGDVQLQLRAEPGWLHLQVLDRGPGVPEALRERIFEPFFRLPGHAELAGGVGLGLALVRQIASAHGGRVRVLPREGGGSVFEISLPA